MEDATTAITASSIAEGNIRSFSPVHGTSGLYLLEEVVTLVVYKDEGREVLYLDLPYGFHTKLGILEELHVLDGVLGEYGCRATDRAKIETTVLLARVALSWRWRPAADTRR